MRKNQQGPLNLLPSPPLVKGAAEATKGVDQRLLAPLVVLVLKSNAKGSVWEPEGNKASQRSLGTDAWRTGLAL